MKRSKHWLWVIAIITVTLVVIFIWQRNILFNYGKKGGSRPHVSVKEIKVNDIGEDRISMTAKLMVSNPLLIPLNADSLQYHLFVDSTKIMDSEFTKALTINALDSTMVVLPIEVDRKRLSKVFKRFADNNSDSADYTLKAKLYFDAPVAGNKIFVKNETRRGPAFRPLVLRTEHKEIEKFGFKHSDVSASLIVENPNLFEISVKNVVYELTIGKDFRLEGAIQKVTRVPARAAVTLPLKMDIHTKNLGRLAWQALFEKKHTPFQMVLSCRMATDNDIFKNTRLMIRREGSLDELKKALPK